MKKTGFKLMLIVVIQLIASFCTQLYAQKIKSDAVPEEVIEAFNSEYTGVKITSWMLDNKLYIATFKEDGAIGKAVYSADGTWLRTIYDIPKTELPSAIEHFVTTTYGKDYVISLACLEELPNSPLHYYIEAKMNGMGMTASYLTFDTEGKLLTRNDPDNMTNSSPEAKSDTKEHATSEKQITPKSETAAKPTKPTKPTTAGTGNPSAAKTNSASTAKKTEEAKASKVTTAKTVASKENELAKTKEAKAKKEADEKAKAEAIAKAKAKKEADEKAKAEAIAKAKAEKEAIKQTEKERKNAVVDQYGNVSLPQRQVPEAVVKSFAKKTSSKEELNWFKIDTFYVAKCIVQSKKNEFFFTPNGTWEKTLIILPAEAVTGNPAKHLSTFYKGYKFVNAIKEQNPSKNDILMVEIYEKENIKQKLITAVLFDKTGKLIRSIDPNYQFDNGEEASESDEKLDKYYEKMDMGLKEDPSKGIPSNIVTAFKAKYPKVTVSAWDRDADGNYVANWFGVKGKEACVIGQSANVIETHVMSNVDNVPMTIQHYVKENYKNYKVVEFYNVKALLEKNNYYKIVVESKKTKSTETLWFTTAGRFIDR